MSEGRRRSEEALWTARVPWVVECLEVRAEGQWLQAHERTTVEVTGR
jgi:hypothetical protein